MHQALEILKAVLEGNGVEVNIDGSNRSYLVLADGAFVDISETSTETASYIIVYQKGLCTIARFRFNTTDDPHDPNSSIAKCIEQVAKHICS